MRGETLYTLGAYIFATINTLPYNFQFVLSTSAWPLSTDRDGPISLSLEFQFQLSQDDWKLIKPRLNDKPDVTTKGSLFRMSRTDYGDVFQKSMKMAKECTKEMKGCTLRFTRHYVYDEKASDKAVKYYVVAYADCKKKDCHVKYTFRIKDIPVDNSRPTVLLE